MNIRYAYSLFESAHDILAPVWLTLNGIQIPGLVKSVRFTLGKVRYDVYVNTDMTTVQEVDSAFVTPRNVAL